MDGRKERLKIIDKKQRPMTHLPEHSDLIPMSDYVLELSKNGHREYEKIHKEGLFAPALKIWICKKAIDYAKFLKQKLEIWMFIPCNEQNEPLEEPEHYELWKKYGDFTQHGKELTKECLSYQKAKERVLFEGFEIRKHFNGKRILTKPESTQVWSYLDAYEGRFVMNWPVGAKTIEDLSNLNLKYRTKTI